MWLSASNMRHIHRADVQVRSAIMGQNAIPIGRKLVQEQTNRLAGCKIIFEEPPARPREHVPPFVILLPTPP